MKIDLHCHTRFSLDSSTPISAILKRCQERGIGVQAITDHGRIQGAQKLRALVEAQPDAGLTVIVGEEIKTRAGEIIGLFLEERIPPGLSAEETIGRIKAQGGLVLLPHPFDPWKQHRLAATVCERIAEFIDIVETFNASVSHPRWNQVAVAWAKAHGILTSAGSDAHVLGDIGRAWVEVPTRLIHSPQDLLQALEDATPTGHWTNPFITLPCKIWDFLWRKFKLWAR